MATLPGGNSVTGSSASADALIQSALATASNVVITAVAGGTVVAGAGRDVAGLSTTAGALVANSSGLSGVVVHEGVVTTTVSTPANTTLVTQGTSTVVTATTAQNYLQALVNSAGTDATTQHALTTMVNNLTSQVSGNVAVHVTSVDASTSTGTIELNLAGNSSNVVQAVVANNAHVVVTGASAVAAVGNATFELGSSGTLVGSTGNQVLVGSAGMDTIIAGSGNATIVGGTGDAVYIGSVGGNVVISSSTANVPMTLDFSKVGVTSLSELSSYITNVLNNADGSTSYVFGSAETITLVGVNVNDLQLHFLS
jgi:hypothetical protein